MTASTPTTAPRPPADTPVLRRTRGPSPQKTELTRKEILQAALEEFTEVGFAQATMDKIAKRAHLAKGTLYLHFESKEALLQAALQATSFFSLVSSMQAPRLPDESMRSYITRLAVSPMRQFRTSGRAALARFILGEANSRPALAQLYIQSVFNPWHDHFAALFQMAIDEGELAGITPQAASKLLGAPFWILLMEDAVRAPDAPDDDHASDLTMAQIQAIFSQTGAR